MTDKPRHKFFHSLDGMRGIAAILVAIWHTGFYFDPIAFQESYLAVDLFFLLSGVVIANAYEKRLRSGLSGVQFAWIRWVRIYPLYFFGLLIAVIQILTGFSDLNTHDLLVLLPFAILLLPYAYPSDSYGNVFPINKVVGQFES